MTPDQQPPIVPGQPENPYWPPRPAPAKKSRLPWIIAAAVAALLIGGTTTGILVAGRDAPTTTTGGVTTPVEEHLLGDDGSDGSITPDPIVDTPAPGPTPRTADIKLTAKITDKQCFGSAGCHVEFKVNLAYGGPVLSADDTWEVTYEITGVEDGPMIGTLEVTGDEYTVNEEFVSTSSSKKKISIKVTGVDKIGL